MTAGMARKGSTAEVPVVGSDRRAAPRVLVDLEVDYALEDNYLFAYITDISETGIFVRTTTPEQPGTRLNLRFKPGDNGPALEVEGEVIWINPFRPSSPDNLHPGMGIRFVALDDELKDRLLELVRRFAYLS
jgi:type IV pilus assembly protein PilZ